MSIVNHATGPKAAPRTFVQPQETKTAQPLDEESTGAGFGDAVEIQLSDAAEEGTVGQKPGNAAYAPAHQARAFLAERAALAEGEGGETVPFGQIVSRIARGIDPAEAYAPPAVEETGATEDAEAATGDEEKEVVEETDQTAAVEDSATTPGAGSGEANVADLLDELVEEDEEESA